MVGFIASSIRLSDVWSWPWAQCSCVQGCSQFQQLRCWNFCLFYWLELPLGELQLPLGWLMFPRQFPQYLELEMARTGSDLPTTNTIEGSVVFLACIANWLRVPSSMLMSNSSAFSGSSVIFKSSFWISGSVMLTVKISLNWSSSNAPRWQNSARDLRTEWNCSMVSPVCWRLVSKR